MTELSFDPTLAGSMTESAMRRLRREMLRELQTGGGLSLAMLIDSAAPTPTTLGLAQAIRARLRKMETVRRQAPERAAELISSLLDHPFAGVDLGAGLAPWSLALAARRPDIQFLAVELPEMVAPLRAAIKAAGHIDRFELAGLDMCRDPIGAPASCDLALLANVAHLLTKPALRDLLFRAAELLQPGGLLVVIDQVLEDDPNWLRWAALYAVGASLWMPGGTLYTQREYRAMLADTGCRWLGAWQLSPTPALTMLTASR
jgi:hypothetical protein